MRAPVAAPLAAPLAALLALCLAGPAGAQAAATAPLPGVPFRADPRMVGALTASAEGAYETREDSIIVRVRRLTVHLRPYVARLAAIELRGMRAAVGDTFRVGPMGFMGPETPLRGMLRQRDSLVLRDLRLAMRRPGPPGTLEQFWLVLALGFVDLDYPDQGVRSVLLYSDRAVSGPTNPIVADPANVEQVVFMFRDAWLAGDVARAARFFEDSPLLVLSPWSHYAYVPDRERLTRTLGAYFETLRDSTGAVTKPGGGEIRGPRPSGDVAAALLLIERPARRRMERVTIVLYRRPEIGWRIGSLHASLAEPPYQSPP